MNEVQILTAEGGYPTGLASRRAERYHKGITYPLGQRRHRRLRRQSHRAYRLKAASQRWRIRAVRLALRQRTCPHVCQSFALCAV